MQPRPVRHEWLEADGLGGFAMGTADIVRTRRYHALLCAATTPPTGRMVLVAGQDVTLQVGAARYPLSAQAYGDGVLHPRGDQLVSSFTVDPWPTWEFLLPDGLRLRHELFVPRGHAALVQRWQLMAAGNVEDLPNAISLQVRPFLAGRDYHMLRAEADGFTVASISADRGIRWRLSHGAPDVLAHGNGVYAPEPLWYQRFFYEEEKARGYDACEDLLAPGSFTFDLRRGPAVLTFFANDLPTRLAGADVDQAVESLGQEEGARRRAFASPLHRAADAYIVARGTGSTLIAGYPWFTDWGRDTFLALRGLCLATGRLEVARDVLCEWAQHVSDGMLPNRFPDRGEVAEYHTADAGLWFVVAADELLRRGRLATRERRTLVEAILQIVSGYEKGTRHGIGMDPADGLLRAGEHGVQVTWMDAIVDGRVVTPRIGKPVELQALWVNALAIAGRFDARCRHATARAKASFEQRFWNYEDGWLHDVVDVDHVPGRIDSRLRCNQVLAVGGLPMPLLDGVRARDVVAAVERELLTPFGLRTLNTRDVGYAPICDGPVRDRDTAYHNGTVWPWLLGPFVDAWLQVHGTTDERRDEAHRRFVAPLLVHLGEAGLGHVSEIFDGDAPHTARGCPFQAWSLGELLRIHTRLFTGAKPTRTTRAVGATTTPPDRGLPHANTV